MMRISSSMVHGISNKMLDHSREERRNVSFDYKIQIHIQFEVNGTLKMICVGVFVVAKNLFKMLCLSDVEGRESQAEQFI